MAKLLKDLLENIPGSEDYIIILTFSVTMTTKQVPPSYYTSQSINWKPFRLIIRPCNCDAFFLSNSVFTAVEHFNRYFQQVITLIAAQKKRSSAVWKDAAENSMSQ